MKVDRELGHCMKIWIKKITKKNFGDALLLPNWTFTLLSTMTPMAVEYFLIYYKEIGAHS